MINQFLPKEIKRDLRAECVTRTYHKSLVKPARRMTPFLRMKIVEEFRRHDFGNMCSGDILEEGIDASHFSIIIRSDEPSSAPS